MDRSMIFLSEEKGFPVSQVRRYLEPGQIRWFRRNGKARVRAEPALLNGNRETYKMHEERPDLPPLEKINITDLTLDP
jgi:hypothetical protein